MTISIFSHVSNIDPGMNFIQMAAGAFHYPHQPLELRSRGGLIPAACPLRARQAAEASGHVWMLHLCFLQPVTLKYHVWFPGRVDGGDLVESTKHCDEIWSAKR